MIFFIEASRSACAWHHRAEARVRGTTEPKTHQAHCSASQRSSMLHVTSWLPPHLPCGASLSVPAPHSLRTAPILGPVGPMCQRVVVHVYVELSYGLPLACIPSSGLLRLAWQQLDSCIVNLGAGWPHTVPRRRSSTVPRVCVRWSQESKWDLQPIPMTQYLLLDVYCKG